jgi:hypothetical protein
MTPLNAAYAGNVNGTALAWRNGVEAAAKRNLVVHGTRAAGINRLEMVHAVNGRILSDLRL